MAGVRVLTLLWAEKGTGTFSRLRRPEGCFAEKRACPLLPGTSPGAWLGRRRQGRDHAVSGFLLLFIPQ